jgi:hypothetical protein
MTLHYDIENDLNEAVSMAEGLEEYLKSDQVYGFSSKGMFDRMPRLTIGALQLRLRRLNALRSRLSDTQKSALNDTDKIVRDVQTEWREHYVRKLLKEIDVRVSGIQSYYNECLGDPELCYDNYDQEIEHRTLVQELFRVKASLKVPDDRNDKRIQEMDAALHSITEPASFQWDMALKSVYPDYEYWWLYSEPRVLEPNRLS